MEKEQRITKPDIKKADGYIRNHMKGRRTSISLVTGVIATGIISLTLRREIFSG